MENRKIGWLGYNSNNDRMGILDNMDLWADDGLHCGECFEVFLNDEWKAERLELGNGEWYLVYSKLSGEQLEGLKVRY
ncbi:DUF5348 domain-containing protein [Clostridium beijerinckii]|uniref:DUF5348 domain-containing protein n=1 Tax=Clostridium beijerinckii TaxID=1520 RepID=A0AAW3WGQ1_CLOBE|nr:DUF5348 domain-containing protein [Clostridium beijerinckii]MBC2460395.1 DUF5348 domain-containing protein [Clostridium beijerinckii]MBC2477872.1 DUF5348 domain-containing protein [Clostridium beijerinckii]NOV63569.1 hypothetical protein [Clostridium beijerinckii]NOV73432.1 hypothetical protein [Clostridium beijerinckii]NOW35453.1 hypothetical protein [Clostridium beijerinckii]